MPIIYLALILFNIYLVKQPKLEFEKEFDIIADFINVDQFGNLYAITGSEIVKLDLVKNQKKTYSNILNGDITSVDTSDPLRILIFFKDFNKIIFLNKDLTAIISPISLDNLGFYDVATVCQSVNGGFWIFDQSFKQLVYINKSLNITMKSAQLSDLINQNHTLDQVFMLEKNDYIYLGVNGENILLFDTYGTYIKLIPLTYNKIFQVNNGIISYLNDKNEFCFYNCNNYTENCVTLPHQNCEQVINENNRLYIQKEQKIFVYKFM